MTRKLNDLERLSIMAFSEVRRWLSIQDLKKFDCRCLAMFGEDDILRCYIADWAHGFKPEHRYARDLVFTTADIGNGSPLDFLDVDRLVLVVDIWGEIL